MSCPKIIHQIWVGPPMPDQVSEYIQTWRDHHPSWEHWLWDEEALASLPMTNQRLYDDAERYALPGRVCQLRSDIARYEILVKHGGLYVDADFSCQAPLDHLMDPSRAWLGWEKQDEWLSNAILASEAAHPFVTLIRDRLERHMDALLADHGPVSNSRYSGPRYVTRLWRKNSWKWLDEGVATLPQATFFPYSWNQLDQGDRDYPDALAVHHWQNQRRIHGKPLPEIRGART